MKHDDRLAEAAVRQHLNRGSKTNRGIEADADFLGVAGEDAFCAWAQGHGLDHGPRPTRRHRGAQFAVNGVSVKIHCSRTPGNLLVKQGHVNADVYLLASYDDRDRTATLLGWVPASVVASAPTRELSKGSYTLRSHAVPVRRLLPMSELVAVLAGAIPVPAQESPQPARTDRPTATQLGFGLDVPRRWGD